MSDNRSSAHAPASIRREKCIIVAGLSGRSLASKPSLATILGWFFTRFFTRGDVADPETTDILANASWRFSHLPQSRGSQILRERRFTCIVLPLQACVVCLVLRSMGGGQAREKKSELKFSYLAPYSMLPAAEPLEKAIRSRPLYLVGADLVADSNPLVS
jgi:hypothetical protein